MLSHRLNLRAVLTLVVVAVVVTAIAPALSGMPQVAYAEEGKPRKIIFVVHDLNPFFVPAIVGMKEFGEMAGWDTQFIGPATPDMLGTVEAQYNAIAAKPDAVAFTAIDSEAFLDPIKAAQDAGIFVVLFNTRAPGVKEATGAAYVGQDFVEAGNVAGYELGKYIEQHTGRKEGKVIMSNFQPGHFALETRNLGGTNGLERYNEEHGTSFTTEALKTSTNEAEAIAIIEAKWAADKDEIVGWLSSEFTHGFIAAWAKENDLLGQFAIGGYDLLDQVLDGIKDGSVDFTIDQNPYAQGFMTSAMIYQGLERGYAASDLDTGAAIVDASNIDEIIAREQLWKDKGAEMGIGG